MSERRRGDGGRALGKPTPGPQLAWSRVFWGLAVGRGLLAGLGSWARVTGTSAGSWLCSAELGWAWRICVPVECQGGGRGHFKGLATHPDFYVSAATPGATLGAAGGGVPPAHGPSLLLGSGRGPGSSLNPIPKGMDHGPSRLHPIRLLGLTEAWSHCCP